MTKAQLIEVAEKMPENFHVDELIEKIVFIAGVEEGLQEIADGQGVPHEEVEKMVEGWRK